MRRIFWAMGGPPGSTVSSTVRPSARRRSARRCICVVLPEPSMPSKVRKRPGVTGKLYCRGRRARSLRVGRNAEARRNGGKRGGGGEGERARFGRAARRARVLGVAKEGRALLY